MATTIMGSPVKKIYGETVSLTTTASSLLFMPGYHEVTMYCSSAWRMALAPRLAKVMYYNGTTYTNYTTYAIDRASGTHVPLDAMESTHFCYLGTTEPTRGFYFDVGDGVNNNAETQAWTFLYDVAPVSGMKSYLKITGTVSAALTVGETVTEKTVADVATGVTGTLVYDDGSTYIVVKDITGGSPSLTTGTKWVGAAQSCTLVTAIEKVAPGTGYWTAVDSGSDGTDSPAGTTFAQDGNYSFTLPVTGTYGTQIVKGAVTNLGSEPLYWYRFTVSGTIDTPLDITEIIPLADTTNYGYMEAATSYNFALNTAQNGAFEFDHTSSGTLDINWIMH